MFLVDRGANVTAPTNYYRSPLFKEAWRCGLYRKDLLSCQHQIWYVDQELQRNSYKFIYRAKEWCYCRLFHRKEWLWQKRKLDWLANETKKERCLKKNTAKKSIEQSYNETYQSFFPNSRKTRKWRKWAS